MLVAVAVIFWIVLMVSRAFFAREVPPEDFVFEEVPIRVGNDYVLLGAKVVQWKLPAKLQQDWLDAVKQQIEAEAKKREEAEKQRQEEAAAKEKNEKGGKAPKGEDVKSGKGEGGGQGAKRPSKASS
jgi:hypothetical protein